MHSEAGSGRAVLRGRNNHGLEREHHGSHVKAIRPHWAPCSALAVESICEPVAAIPEAVGAQKWAQSDAAAEIVRAN